MRISDWSSDVCSSDLSLDWLSATGNALIMAPRAWVRRADMMTQMRGKWGYALAVGALSPMPYLLVLSALQLGAPDSLVAPLRETPLMIATDALILLLKEKSESARVVG